METEALISLEHTKEAMILISKELYYSVEQIKMNKQEKNRRYS